MFFLFVKSRKTENKPVYSFMRKSKRTETKSKKQTVTDQKQIIFKNKNQRGYGLIPVSL